MDIVRRLWHAIKALGCVGRHRSWGSRSGPCLCERISRTVLHPYDWQDITLDRLPDGTVLWGLPVISEDEMRVHR